MPIRTIFKQVTKPVDLCNMSTAVTIYSKCIIHECLIPFDTFYYLSIIIVPVRISYNNPLFVICVIHYHTVLEQYYIVKSIAIDNAQ